MRKIHLTLLLLTMAITIFFRFSELGSISTGLHADEASQAYNAFSILKTGKDMYGKSFPILFRANGSYQPPVYTYLTIIPTIFFGNSVFTARFISAFFGVVLVFLTFMLLYYFGVGKKEERIKQGLFAALTLSIAPWAVHFSRLAVEGKLVVSFIALGLITLLFSLKKKWFFVVSMFIFGLTTHVYYTERITSIIFVAIFLFLFREKFRKRKKEVVLGIFTFSLVLLPHLYIAKTGALTKRLAQVGYSNGGVEESSFFNKTTNFVGQFADHYLFYYSPKNLFFDPGESLGRTASDLSVFFPWFFIFGIIGLAFLLEKTKSDLVKVIFVLLVVSPLPAGITGDLFYPLRVLTFLWVVTLLVSFGFYRAWVLIKPSFIRVALLSGIFFYSAFYFYISYFATSRYASSPDLGYSHINLINQIEEYDDKKILVDTSSRSWGAGIRMAYLMNADPKNIQNQLNSFSETPYYSATTKAENNFRIRNVEVKPIAWDEVCGDAIAVGDKYAINEFQAREHGMNLIFSIKNIINEDTLFGYLATQECSKDN